MSEKIDLILAPEADRSEDSALVHNLKGKAASLGFTQAAVIPAQPSQHSQYYEAWLKAGHSGDMAYLARPDAVARRADLSLTVPEAKSVIALSANYHTQDLPPDILNDPSRGIIASYAWNIDYHTLLTPRLYELQGWLEAQVDQPIYGRAYIDTGPVLERELAARAGLGFIGKNTCLIHPDMGSYVFLAEIILDYELPFDQPEARGTCGRCTRCLTACPTDAFPEPYILDSRRCISYLTIEFRGDIPLSLRPLLGNRIFGCDICQEVCPYNRRFALPTDEPAFRATFDQMAPSLLDLIALNDDGFRTRFRKSPIKRSKRRGFLRNVCIALGNWGNPAAIPALEQAGHDHEPLISSHAAWALAQVKVAE